MQENHLYQPSCSKPSSLVFLSYQARGSSWIGPVMQFDSSHFSICNALYRGRSNSRSMNQSKSSGRSPTLPTSVRVLSSPPTERPQASTESSLLPLIYNRNNWPLLGQVLGGIFFLSPGRDSIESSFLHCLLVRALMHCPSAPPSFKALSYCRLDLQNSLFASAQARRVLPTIDPEV